MTDEQIIKDLQACLNFDDYGDRDCAKCSQEDWRVCRDNLMKQALDLINHQKAEIKWLKECTQNLLAADTDLSNGVLDAKSGAIKEFADKMTTYIERIPRNDFCLLEVEGIIDKILKEMTGENNA